MISTKFDVVVFKKDMDNDDLPGFAKMIERNYDNGFRFLESFDAADLGFVVSSKSVEVAMSTAPTTEPAKRPPLSEWPSYVLEINRLRLIEQQYTIGRVWNIAGYVMDWHGCDGELRITESINELFELVSAVQDVLTNAGIAIAITGQGLNHHVTRRAFVEQIAEIICEQAKGIGQDAATTVQEASDPMTKEFFLDYEELKSLREANKRQSRIIDDLLRDKVNLIEKKNSLAESVMSLTDLNSEIAEKCEGMMSEQDAKTLANAAYNRGRSIGELHCTLDFENWWVEFRKENGFDKPEPKSLLDRVIDVACDYFGWKGNLDDAMRISDNNLDGFLDTVTRKLNMFGGNMATINHYVDKGYTRMKFLREIAVELYEGKK